MTLLFGIAALLVILWSLKLFSKADVHKFATTIRSPALKKKAAGVGVLILASILQARGQILIGVALDFLGVYLLGVVPGLPAGWGARTQKSGGQVSRVRSAFLEMEMDLDSGVTVRLGRREVDERIERFIHTASQVISHRLTEIAYVDMRYSNGFAIGWRNPSTPPSVPSKRSDDSDA